MEVARGGRPRCSPRASVTSPHEPYPSFQTFDVSSRRVSGDAPRTNTPLQALVTLNDPVFVEAAALAERFWTNAQPELDDRIDYLFVCVLSRIPSAAERSVLSELYRAARRYTVAKPPRSALQDRAAGDESRRRGSRRLDNGGRQCERRWQFHVNKE